MAGSPSTRNSSLTGPRGACRTRCAWRAAIAHRIPTATRDRPPCRRHGRARHGHPRLASPFKAWMPGTRRGMTAGGTGRGGKWGGIIGRWLALVGLGFSHGITPAMGWLFAVALGLNRQNQQIVMLSLLPIALGHAASVALVVAVVLAL